MPTSLVAEPVINVTVTMLPSTGDVAQAATQAVQPIDTWMKINPWFDWSVIFGIPFWVFIGAFLALVFLTVNLYWFFRIKKLQAVRGYVDAVKMATQEDVMTWIISTTKNLTIECLKKRDSVLSFYDPINITKWVHTSREAVIHIGGKGGVIVSEDYYKTRDMVSEIALCAAAEDYNAKLEPLMNEAEQNPDGEAAEMLKKIHKLCGCVSPMKNYSDYESFGRNILEIIHPDGLSIPPYNIFDPDKFKKYFPEGLTATFSGGIFVRDARNLNLGSNKLGFWEKMIPFGIICGFVIICVVCAWMVPLGGA